MTKHDMEEIKGEVLELLKDKLRVQVHLKNENDHGLSVLSVKVVLFLGKDEIDYDSYSCHINIV